MLPQLSTFEIVTRYLLLMDFDDFTILKFKLKSSLVVISRLWVHTNSPILEYLDFSVYVVLQ